MDTLHPSGTGLLFHRASPELEPRPIEEVERLVEIRPPHHHRSRICHQAEPLFAFAQRGFDAAASSTLDEQHADQQCLQRQDQAGADHVMPVLGPERWYLEQDDAAGRERALGNAPTGQLARVEGRDLGCAIGGDILRPGAAGDTQGDFRSLRGATHRIVDDTPDGSVTEERSPGTVDGDGGRARDSVQDNAWLLAYTGILMSCSCVEDDRSSRERPHGREQFIVAEVGQVGEFHPALELFELL